MKVRMKKTLVGILSATMASVMFYVPGSLIETTKEVSALTTGDSRTFNNTSTGYSFANTNNSSGILGNEPSVSGGIYNWTVPETGYYKIEAWGAQGGKGYSASSDGGLGARMTGDIILTKGDVLKVLVGQKGTDFSGSSPYGGGGGGGTFVATLDNSPLMVAGGGGGSSVNVNENTNATTATNGMNGSGSGMEGGQNGLGGKSTSYGSGGAGFIGNGEKGGSPALSNSFINGGVGSNNTTTTGGAGGFGGGGSGHGTGGGGGGYSGGGSGGGSNPYYGGGGGGSYNAGNNQSNSGGVKTGHGQVVITFIEPSATLSPVNATKFQNNYIDVSWTGIKHTDATITKYEIQAGTTLGGSNILALTNKGTATTHRLTVPPGTAGNTAIYWQVRVTDSLGRVGQWQQSSVIYSNNVPKITATTNTPTNLDVSLERRHHQFSINSLVDPDDFNYVTLFADVLDSGGTVIPGSKQQIVLDADLMNNSPQLIKGTSTEKDGSLQGPLNHTTKFNLKLYLEPDFTTGKFNIGLTKADGVTNVIKGNKKLITGRTMQLTTAGTPENFTLRVYPEDRQNTNTLANNALASIPDVMHINMPFTSDTRNYLPRLTNVKDDVANRVFSDSQGFNKITVTGHVDDSDPADTVTMYYEVQPKASNYSIAVTTKNGKVVPANGKSSQVFTPKVDNDFAFTYQLDSSLDTGNYALIVYGYDSQEGIGNYHEIPFKVDRGGPSIDFTAEYTTTSGQKVMMSTAQKQVVAENSIGKYYFTPNNYATFEYAGYLVRDNAVKDLRIRGAFTNQVKATFIGVDFGQNPITLMNGEQTEFKIGDVIVFKFKATSSTGIVTEKDIRILIGNDNSTFAPLDDANLPSIP